jgi:hypothetical protein
MHFYCVLSRKYPELIVAGEQDTAGVTLRQRKSKSVVNGQAWTLPQHFLHAQNPLAWKVRDF